MAVLGLGSAGAELDRFDDHSDLDFFVIVADTAAKLRLLSGTGWIESAGELVFSFVNDPNGRKALLADATFLEYAIFTVAELGGLAFTGARTVWLRPGAPTDLAERGLPPTQPGIPTENFHLNEAVTNLFVGLHREMRGERLTAFRFIQVFAVDRALALLRLSQDAARRHVDPFEPTRRAERFYGPSTLPLAQMLPGYGSNVAAARATYQWLSHGWTIDPHLAAAVENVLALASPEA